MGLACTVLEQDEDSQLKANKYIVVADDPILNNATNFDPINPVPMPKMQSMAEMDSFYNNPSPLLFPNSNLNQQQNVSKAPPSNTSQTVQSKCERTSKLSSLTDIQSLAKSVVSKVYRRNSQSKIESKQSKSTREHLKMCPGQDDAKCICRIKDERLWNLKRQQRYQKVLRSSENDNFDQTEKLMNALWEKIASKLSSYDGVRDVQTIEPKSEVKFEKIDRSETFSVVFAAFDESPLLDNPKLNPKAESNTKALNSKQQKVLSPISAKRRKFIGSKAWANPNFEEEEEKSIESYPKSKALKGIRKEEMKSLRRMSLSESIANMLRLNPVKSQTTGDDLCNVKSKPSKSSPDLPSQAKKHNESLD